jgi:hypothetical protein
MLCGNCHSGLMVRRFGRFGEFMGCTNYPRCKEWHPIQRESIRPHPEVVTKSAESAKTPEIPARSTEMAAKMEMKLETISPERAAALLAKNVSNNRAIVRARVDQLADAIKEDRFRTTPEGIMLNEAGNLIDGQHRLSAVVTAGKPVKMYVWYNVPTDMMEAINVGQTRTLADVLTITGELGIKGAPKIAVARASAINLIFTPEQNTKKLTKLQYEWVRENYAEDIEWTLKNYPLSGGSANAGAISRKFRSVMVMGALAIAHKKYPEQVEVFARKADKGVELLETDPAYALRRYLDNSTLTGGGAPRLTVAYATFRCVSAALRHEKLGIVKPAFLTETNPEFSKVLRTFGVI